MRRCNISYQEVLHSLLKNMNDQAHEAVLRNNSTGSGRKTWRFEVKKKTKNENYTVFLREFITKIIFISKHYNYNIHFLNIVSVRWRPLLSAHSRKRKTSDKSLTQSFDVLRSSKWRLSSWTFSSCSRRCFSEVSHPQQYSLVTMDTVVPMNTEVPTKYPLSHDDRIVVLEIGLHSKSPKLYRPALHGNWNALSLARRALKDEFPTPIPLTAMLPNHPVFLPDPVLNLLGHFWPCTRSLCCPKMMGASYVLMQCHIPDSGTARGEWMVRLSQAAKYDRQQNKYIRTCS